MTEPEPSWSEKTKEISRSKRRALDVTALEKFNSVTIEIVVGYVLAFVLGFAFAILAQLIEDRPTCNICHKKVIYTRLADHYKGHQTWTTTN